MKVVGAASTHNTGIRRAAAAVMRRLGYAPRYASRFDWLGSFYDAIARAWPDWSWPGAGHTVQVRLRALSAPLHLRLGSTDWFVAEEVFLRDVYGLVRKVAPSDTTTILDLGANIGLTLALWHAWWPEARMVAVEPDDDNLRVLRRNVVGFAEQVRVLRACATGTERELELDRRAGEDAYRIAEIGTANGTRVAGRTVGEVLASQGIEVVDLLKCDIEGAEREVFSACEAWIRQVRCLVVEVHDGLTVPELGDLLARAGGRFESLDSGDPTVGVFRQLG